MNLRKKAVEPLGHAVAEILRIALKNQELNSSYRWLAGKSGMSLNRIGIIFRHHGPTINVDELSRIADALDLQPSAVLAEAEKQLGLTVANTDADTVESGKVVAFPGVRGRGAGGVAGGVDAGQGDGEVLRPFA